MTKLIIKVRQKHLFRQDNAQKFNKACAGVYIKATCAKAKKKKTFVYILKLVIIFLVKSQIGSQKNLRLL